MAKFVVHDSIIIPTIKLKSGMRQINVEELKERTKTDSDFSKLLGSAGVYIFSIKAGKGEKPWYVGRTTKQTFLREAFNDRNIRRLHSLINDRKGTLKLTLIPQKRIVNNKPNLQQIGEMEYFLIGYAHERNPEILNTQNTTQEDRFVIEGVYNEQKRDLGRTKTQRDFQKLIGFD